MRAQVEAVRMLTAHGARIEAEDDFGEHRYIGKPKGHEAYARARARRGMRFTGRLRGWPRSGAEDDFEIRWQCWPTEAKWSLCWGSCRARREELTAAASHSCCRDLPFACFKRRGGESMVWQHFKRDRAATASWPVAEVWRNRNVTQRPGRIDPCCVHAHVHCTVVDPSVRLSSSALCGRQTPGAPADRGPSECVWERVASCDNAAIGRHCHSHSSAYTHCILVLLGVVSSAGMLVCEKVCRGRGKINSQ
jgi:hypothetical protein